MALDYVEEEANEPPPPKRISPDNVEAETNTAFGGAYEDTITFSPDSVEAIELSNELREHSADLRSHARVAHLVAAENIGKLMHVANLGWFAWNGKHFVKDSDDKRTKVAAMHAIRRLAPDALGDANFLADLRQSQTSSGIDGVLRLMGSLEGIRAEVDELDADPYLLNVANGVLDLRELKSVFGAPVVADWRKMTLHPHDPKYRMTQITKARFDPRAHSDVWTRFLGTSLVEDGIREYLQRALGAGLIGIQLEHLLPILQGEGRNGKGVFYEAIDTALGSYSDIAKSSLFEVVKGDPNRPDPASLDLRGKRLVFMSETAKTAQMDFALVKRLTGGDPIKARGVHKNDSIVFQPSHLLVLITNYFPQMPANDPAVWARVRVCSWNVVIPEADRDPELKQKLWTKPNSDAILAWLLEGLLAYESDGLTPPPEVLESTEGFKAEQDTVARFIDEACVEVPVTRGDAVSALHDAYFRWCGKAGIMREHRLEPRAFGTRLDVLGFPDKKSGGKRFRAGLQLDSGFDSDAYVAALSGQVQALGDPPAVGSGPVSIASTDAAPHHMHNNIQGLRFTKDCEECNELLRAEAREGGA